MAYVNPYEKDEQARGQVSGERSLAEIYGINGQGETSAPAPAEEQTAVGTVRRVIHTVDDVKKQVAKGALSSIEGVADFVIGASSLFGSLPQVVMAAVSDDYRERVKQAIAYDVSGKWFDLADNVRERLLGSRFGQYSYQKEGGLLQQVEQGIGGMLPAVAVSVATAGLAAPAAAGGTAASAGTAAKAGMTAAKAAKLAEAASLTTMGLGAAGQATQEAYNDGAGYVSGLAYGAARGATEVATEKMFGGVTKAFTGGGMLPSVGRSVASTGVKRFIKEAVEEGAEEMVSELADPATRAIYRGKDAFLSYLDPETYKAVAEAGLVGAVTGGVFQGTVGAATGSSGRAADVAEVLSEVDTLEQKRKNLDTNGKLTAEVEGRLYEDIRANYRVLEEVLKKTAPEKRAALMEKNGLSGVFAEDGSLQPAFLAELDRRAAAGRSDSDGTGFDRRTASLEAEADKVAAVLAKEGRTQFTDVDSLSKVGRENLKKVKRVMNVFYDVSGGAVGNFVIANESAADNAYYDTDSGYIVLGADVLEKGMNVTHKGVQSWFETVLHEATHGTEGTETWVYLAESLKQLEGGRYYNDMLKHLGNRGYLDGKAADIRAEAEKINRKLEKGEALTAKQKAFLRVYASEGVSIMAELALGNEHFARRLLDADASLVEKLLNRIADMKEALSRRKDAVAQEAFAEIVAAEEMFLAALTEKGWRFESGEIVGARGEDDEEIEGIHYSFKNTKNGMANDSLLPYDDELSDLIEQRGDYIIDSYEKLEQIVHAAFENPSLKATAYFGIVDAETLNKIKNSVPNLPKDGLGTLFKEGREYSIAATFDSIRHIVDDKGLTRKDVIDYLDRLADTIVDFDSVAFNYYEKGNNSIAGLIFKKHFTDGTLVSFDLVSHKKRSIALQTLYLDRASYQKKKFATTLPMQNASGNTSETQASQTSKNSIHDSEPIVNASDEISSKKSAGEVKKSRKANPQEGKKAPAWEKSPPTKKYLGVEATERVVMIDDRAYGTTNITKAIDNVIAALQAEIDESVEVSENKELVVRLSDWKKSSSVNELINRLKEANTPQEKDVALDAVVDAVLADAYVKTIISDDSMMRAVETVNRLKPYRRNIDLSQTGVSKPIYQKWGNKVGIPLAEVMEDLPTAVRLTAPGDTVAVMQDVDKAYEAARQYIQINKSHKIQYFMGEADEALLRERMKEAFKADLTAKTSAEAVERLEKQYHKQLDRATNVYNFSHRMNTIFKLSLNMRDIKTGRFLNQSQPENHNILNRTLGQLCRVMNGGSLNKSCRKYFQQVYEWYEHDAKNYLKYDEKTGRGEYSPAIADKLKKIGESQSAFFTYEELGDIINIFQYFKHMTENYQKVWRNGKMVEAVPEAKKYVGIAIENQQLHQGKIDYIYRSFYTRLYGDPHMLVRYMDCYREGFYTTMFERLRQGCVASQVTLLRMNQKINEALEDPKDQKKRKKRNAERKDGVVKAASRDTKYFESLQTRTIQLHGGNMPVGKAISLWLTCKRDQAKSGLLENGYSFEGEGDKETGIRRVFGFTGDERVRDAEGNIKPEYQQMIQSMQDEIYAQLTEQDKRLIRVVEEIMNHDCKELKWKTDLALNGWSNAALEYYFPIRRYQTFTSIDSEGFFGEVDRVSNASFNKNTTPGAKNQLLIESVEVVLDRHMRGVAKYAGLAQVIRDYDTLRTLDISGNPNAAVSIATVETEKGGWHEGTEFFKKLLEDVQGIKPDSDEVTRFIGKLRGHYARAALSLNPKVIATQFSSVFAGMNIIDADCMARAFKDSGRDVFAYSELAELRASENTAAMAQGLLDEAGDFLMKPIGATDAWVVRRLFVACQYQVAKNNRHLGIGTEENKKAAAKLLDKVIFETQQNSLATEKSQAARSSSEFQKMMTMFTSDAVKGVGQLLDAIGEITVIRNEARVSGQAVDKIRLAKARRRAGRATVCLVSVAVYSAILAAGIKKLLDRDDEWGWGDFFSEVGAGLLGGLPWVKEIYDAFFGAGYGVEDMSVAAINDLMESITGGFNAMGSFVSGELSGREAASAGRKLIYAIGNVVGLPARNTYTWGRRIVGILSQDAAYEMENFFKEQPYRSDIAKAIEAGDEGRLETVIGVMLDENVGEVTSSAVRQEMKRLISAGVDVLPRGVGDTVTVDGEAITLTERQKKAFRAVYSEANRSVEKMVGLAYYAKASDEAKAKAIKRVYGIYYNRAIEELLGVELENKNTLLAEAIDPEVLAVVLAVCGEIEADKDKDGRAVAGSKRRKIEDFVESLKLKAAQKFIIMGALGYKNKLGREKVEAYVKGLSLSSEEKEELMTIGGY